MTGGDRGAESRAESEEESRKPAGGFRVRVPGERRMRARVCLWRSLCFSLCFSLPLSFSLSLFLSLFLSLSHSLTRSLALALAISLASHSLTVDIFGVRFNSGYVPVCVSLPSLCLRAQFRGVARCPAAPCNHGRWTAIPPFNAACHPPIAVTRTDRARGKPCGCRRRRRGRRSAAGRTRRRRPRRTAGRTPPPLGAR